MVPSGVWEKPFQEGPLGNAASQGVAGKPSIFRKLTPPKTYPIQSPPSEAANKAETPSTLSVTGVRPVPLESEALEAKKAIACADPKIAICRLTRVPTRSIRLSRSRTCGAAGVAAGPDRVPATGHRTVGTAGKYRALAYCARADTAGSVQAQPLRPHRNPEYGLCRGVCLLLKYRPRPPL